MKSVWKKLLYVCKLGVLAAPVAITPYLNEAMATGGGGSGSTCDSCLQPLVSYASYNDSGCTPSSDEIQNVVFNYNQGAGYDSWYSPQCGATTSALKSDMEADCAPTYNCITAVTVYSIDDVTCNQTSCSGPPSNSSCMTYTTYNPYHVRGVIMATWTCGNT